MNDSDNTTNNDSDATGAARYQVPADFLNTVQETRIIGHNWSPILFAVCEEEKTVRDLDTISATDVTKKHQGS
jgi:hypothetical protein